MSGRSSRARSSGSFRSRPGIFGAVLASIPAGRAHVVFDPAVDDPTAELDDPVDILSGTQLGGGTGINRALAYRQVPITRPQEPILVLISDLLDGGDRAEMLKRAADLAGSGAQMVALLALSDDGSPSYDHQVAAAFAELGTPAFARAPDLFPELMDAAIGRRDLARWAAARDIVASRGASRP